VALWQKQFAHATAYCRRCGLLRFFGYVRDIGGPNLIRQVPKLRTPQPRTTIATPEELLRLEALAPPWLRVWLLLCTRLGLRFGTAAAIAPANWNPAAGTITFTTKGGVVMTLPTPPEIEELFRSAGTNPDPATPYWLLLRGDTGLRGSTKYPTCSLRAEWDRLKKKAGVRPDLRPHDFRRTIAVSLYEATKDIRAVQQLLGHNSLATTAHYLMHRDPGKLRALLAALWTPKGGSVQ
jgi:integrase